MNEKNECWRNKKLVIDLRVTFRLYKTLEQSVKRNKIKINIKKNGLTKNIHKYLLFFGSRFALKMLCIKNTFYSYTIHDYIMLDELNFA